MDEQIKWNVVCFVIGEIAGLIVGLFAFKRD